MYTRCAETTVELSNRRLKMYQCLRDVISCHVNNDIYSRCNLEDEISNLPGEILPFRRFMTFEEMLELWMFKYFYDSSRK